jgi:hypothetical protein
MHRTAFSMPWFMGAILAALCLAGPASAADDLTRPICVSPDGHFLSSPDGSPFFWLGDTAWSMFMRLTREESEEYLKDRAAKGFNVIQAVALGGPLDFLDAPNRYGHLPLIDGDFARPNPKYFEHVDWVLDRAAQHGLRIALLPIWGLNQVTIDRSVDAAAAQSYGRWIGRRYRNKGVIWVLGGDTTPMWRMDPPTRPNMPERVIQRDRTSVIDDRPVYDAMAAGIVAGAGGDPFITFHPTNLSFSGTAQPRTSLYFHERTWLDMNMIQSSHFIDPSAHLKSLGADFSWLAPYSYQPIGEEYRSKPVRPIVDGEPRFEDLAIDLERTANKGYWTGYDARNAAYHALFAGAAGHTYGNHSVWQFFDSSHKRLYQLPREGAPWRLALGRESTTQMGYAKALFLSRPYFTRIPDQSVVVSDQSEGSAHVSATRDKDGSYTLVYLPQGQPVTLNMSKVSGLRAVGWWFDPRTGNSKKIDGAFATTGSTTFVPPTAGPVDDWILVVDDESKAFGAPGTVHAQAPIGQLDCQTRLSSAPADKQIAGNH